MADYSGKQHYAGAVLSGFMTKTEAYLEYINPDCTHPSQAAYKLEQTKQMKRIIAQVKTELALTRNLVTLTDQTTTVLAGLLKQQDTLPVAEQLAIIRAANNLSGKAKTLFSKSLVPPIPPSTKVDTPVLDKASAVI